MNKLRDIVGRLLTHFTRGTRFQQTVAGQLQQTGTLLVHKPPPTLQVQASDEVQVRDDTFNMHQTGGGVEAFRGVDGIAQIAGDLDTSGSVVISAKGFKPPQNESGRLEVCRILVARLNQAGASWGKPDEVQTGGSKREEGWDCEAKDKAGVHGTLKVQVTRVERDIWHDLHLHSEAIKTSDVDRIAETIRDVIQGKSQRVPEALRHELTLALDATKTPTYAFLEVVTTFRKYFASDIAKCGYQGVWMVGPTFTLTSRLDELDAR